MKVSTKEFKEVLTKLSPAFSKADIDIFSYITFDKKNIVSYNDKVCVIHPFQTEIECSVKASPLFDIIKGLNDQEIEVEIKDSKLFLSGEDIKAELSLGDNTINEYIQNISEIDKEWKPVPDDFLYGIKLCSFSVSKDIARPFLMGIHVNKSTICSSDNYRISRYKLSFPIEDSFLIPGVTAKELLKFSIKEYALHLPWVIFKTNDGVEFYVKLLMVEFPDVEKFFDSMDGYVLKAPEKLKPIVDSLSPFPEGDMPIERKITLYFDGKKLNCEAFSQGVYVKRWIEGVETEDELKIQMSIDFLRAILSQATEMIVSKDKVMFKKENFEHLMTI